MSSPQVLSRPLPAAVPFRVVWVVAGFAFAFALIVAFWVGYIQSDDMFYADAARGWGWHAPYLGETHWGLRHLIVLPMALAFRLVGESEAALLVPTLAYAAGLLGLVFVVARRIGGTAAGAVAVAVAGGVPVLATGASLVSTDVPEAFCVLASLWAFHLGETRRRAWLLVLAGALAGGACITRETSLALLVLYGLLFLAGYGGRRLAYLWIGAGFAAVIVADWAYLYAVSGDPLYRQHISLQGVAHDGPQQEARYAAAPGMDRFGALAVPRWVKPLVVLFANQNFGLFFWLAVPATAWLALRAPAGPVRRAARLFGGLGLVWVVVQGWALMPWLWVIPRYYAAAASVLAVPLGVALARGLAGPRRLWAAAALALLLASDAALAMGVGEAFHGERALAGFMRGTTEQVWTDPSTAAGAIWLLERDGTAPRLHVGPPPPGGIFFFNARPRRPTPADWTLHTPAPDWILLATLDPPRKWTGFIAHLPGLEGHLPAGLADKLDPPPHTVRVYRAPGG